ncbi:hypothetical protein BDV28DRAFT_165125 [Aspergillus coremiiformis]|uniref:Tyrosinase copper-binding domain-containing protein n=1 Tax=Aspergillus coremiiformis TaxID=138285 RepID=A0A5N6Z8Z5_9EURO|nr:hypothetical protein BDV28DRAFT_165125 [Aspergillus coremiiformis]
MGRFLLRQVISLYVLIISAISCLAFPAAGSCSPEEAVTRKEWRELDNLQRREYIDAIRCLRKRPSVLPNEEFPGVRDRLDDFIATHINYTNTIHNNGLLLPWHRHFLTLWGKTLRQECGYKGGLPYWNWALDAGLLSLSQSPVFDGSGSSLSGNGLYDPAERPICNTEGECLPRGTGGGCVYSGPFENFTVHMGPFNSSLAQPYSPLPPNAFAYNPHCLTRSLNPPLLASMNNQTLVDQMQSAETITEFLAVMEPSDENSLGSHGGGHHGVGGTMVDLFTSPQDPVFILHHGMIDRMWTQWQNQDVVNRRYALNGTTVIYDPPGAPPVTLDTVVEFGPLDIPRKVREIMDPLDRKYCYRYT